MATSLFEFMQYTKIGGMVKAFINDKISVELFRGDFFKDPSIRDVLYRTDPYTYLNHCSKNEEVLQILQHKKDPSAIRFIPLLLPESEFFMKINNRTFILCDIRPSVYDYRGMGESSTIRVYGKDAYRFLNNYYKSLRSSGRIRVNDFTGDDFVEYQKKKVQESEIIIQKEKYDEIFTYIDNTMVMAKEILDKTGNVPFHPGILLIGEKGTGKSTLVKLIASKYNADIMKFSISNFRKVISQISNNSVNPFVCVFEDFDMWFEDGEIDPTKKDEYNALLQFLDGESIMDTSNFIFVATTNYVDKIDNRFIRAGRFDKKVNILPFDEDLAEEFCELYNTELSSLTDVEFPITPVDLREKIFTQRSTK